MCININNEQPFKTKLKEDCLLRIHDKGFLIRKGRIVERYIVETTMKYRQKVTEDLLNEKLRTTDNGWFFSSEFPLVSYAFSL